MSITAPVLSLERIEKRFGEVHALAGASLALRPGTVHALLGENGAGKTTLLRIAFGLLRPDGGVVRVAGAPRRFRSPADAIAAGIGMVHQHFSLVPALTVAENVALGGHGRFDAAGARRRVERASEESGLAIDATARVASLSVGEQQRVEILKALAHGARILILDEPTAVLAPESARDLLVWLRRFADHGGSAVLITHKVRDALAVADDLTVLRHGATTLTCAAADATEVVVLDAMLGDPSPRPEASRGALGGAMDGAADPSFAVRIPASARAPVIALHDACVVDARGVLRLRNVTLEVHAAQILGVAAVEGAGQRELIQLLAGRLEPTTGLVDRPALVGFIPDDRHRDALILDFDLAENIALRGAGTRRGRMGWRRITAETRALVEQYEIVARGPRTTVRSLSGGNQQKLVLARELADAPSRSTNRHPSAIVAENPTRGLDARASAVLLARLRDARARGTAIVVYSSDLDELLSLADRVVVVHAGRVHETPLDRDAIGRAMLGS